MKSIMTKPEPPPPHASLTVEQTLQQAIAHHKAGLLHDADRLYHSILQIQPDHADANHNLGVLAVEIKQPTMALPYFRKALETNSSQRQYWLSYIDALIQSDQRDIARQVLADGRQLGLSGGAVEALTMRLAEQKEEHSPPPQETEALVRLFADEKFALVEALARAMTVRFPLHGVGWKALGAVLKKMGRSADALTPMLKAAALSPGDSEVHNNLGITLQALGRLDEADASYRQALQIEPEYPGAHSNLGTNLQAQGRLGEAEASYRRALHFEPNCDHALNNLALLLNAQGKSMIALNTIKQSLRIKETSEAKKIFVICASRLNDIRDDGELRAILARALTEPWGRPSELARVGAQLVKLRPEILGSVIRATNAWPSRLAAQDLFESNGLAALGSDGLMLALLDLAPICDIEMERFLTLARCALLDAATAAFAPDTEFGTALIFYSALARQCFINEYVYSLTDHEIRKSSDLRNSLVTALESEAPIPTLWILAVAAYFPLCSLPIANRLLKSRWPKEVEAVLVQQILEPEAEAQERGSIPRLTDIDDRVSRMVQSQYEENPYPRWVKTTSAANPEPIVEFVRRRFPLADFKPYGSSDRIDVLVAGCGTGQQSIAAAQKYQGAQVLAVDLSVSSLAYAKRKSRESGLASIDYAQADLLKLGSLDRSFDLIESSGVLHHLADPLDGWRVLLSLLRPGGFMRLGLYSEIARRNIVRARDFITDQGYGSTLSDIRLCRLKLMELSAIAEFGNTLKLSDFFSTSACRDLLFHVQEHRMTLTMIDAFLRENKLIFLGFDIEADILEAYRRRFPDDRSATNLAQWQTFENEHPDTFIGMYQFWIQAIG